jgi:hypothetical protein
MGMYGLLDATVTAALDAEEFVGWCELHREQLEIHAQHIQDTAADKPLQMQARLPLYGGRAVAMTIDSDSPSRWRLVDPLPFAVGANSPLELLAELSALVESGAMDHALSMMTESMRAQYLAELQLVATALATADEAVVTVDGHWAEVSLGDTIVELRRSNGAWQIESVEQVNYYGYDEGY